MLRTTPAPIATLVDSLRGREYIDVRLAAKRGQVILADLRSTREGDEQLVTFSANERNRIPDSVICGG
jgi:hypothetical protein